ncbi:MAG: c-type cytochrome [Acidobacteria bacterium]|nr:MAG: c-type cytochrome [Acidobacteriota bacterium]
MNRHLTAMALLVLMGTGAATAGTLDLGSDAQREAGRVLYDKYCAQCHGDTGDGKGIAADRLNPRPRDFTSGKYKIRSTSSGNLPTTRDLMDIIRKGLPYTSMPPWPQLSETELTELAYYLKAFAPAFADPDFLSEPLDLPEPPPFTEESAQRGSQVYTEIGCGLCHGELARGDGRSAPTLTDDWGDSIRVADLTKRWTFRGGPRRKDIFRAFTTALNGTPMPSYAESMSVEKRWELTDYVWSLSPGDDPAYDNVLRAKKISRQIDLQDLDGLFDAAEQAYFPVIGQIMEPGREFHPSATGVKVRAVYNEIDLAVELRWNDMRAETSGSNGPDLEVPRFEDDPERGASAGTARVEGSDDEDDFWGDEEESSGEDDFWAEEEEVSDEDDFWGDEEAEADGAPSGPETEFSDAVAIQFPSQVLSGNRKPYFIFGDGKSPVDIWFMDLARQRPEMFVGRGSSALESQGMGELSAVASFDRGQWTVVYTRPLRDGGVIFEEGSFLPMAFSLWDGFNRERGNKRGLTRWVSLFLEPGGKKSVTGPVVKVVLLTLLVEFLIIGLVRRRYRGGVQGAVPASRA